MMSKPPRRDLRVVGATLALGLDVAMLGFAGLLVLASLSPALGFVLAGAVGLVVAPVFGWQYGPVATNRARSGWASDALKRVLLVAGAITIAVVAVQAVTVPVEGGIVGRLALIAYAIVVDLLAIGFLTFVSVLLLGVPWTRLMRWIAQ